MIGKYVCPDCGRAFDKERGDISADGVVHCPYCAFQEFEFEFLPSEEEADEMTSDDED